MRLNVFKSAPAVQKQKGKAHRVSILPAMIVGLVAFMGTSSLLGFMINIADQAMLADHVAQTRDVQGLQTALVDAEIGARGYVGTGDLDDLSAYLAAAKTIDDSAPLLHLLDKFAAAQPGAKPFSDMIVEVENSWRGAIRMMRDNQAQQAEAALHSAQTKDQIGTLRGYLVRYITQTTVEADAAQRRIDLQHVKLLIINMTGALIAIATMIYAFYSSARQARGRDLAIAEGRDAHKQVEQLFFMADMLQSANDQDDTNAVLRSAARNMLPGFGGAMYVFNHSRDRLDLATRWGVDDKTPCDCAVDHFAPNACWSLKRGKANLNRTEAGALRCSHVTPGQVTLEIPMAARGQLHGLLEIVAEGADAEERLNRIRPTAAAIGDAMSLALSSMALRDRLRNQALRDALTGLYNRRFLEETLERLGLDSERRKSPMSAIMIDLDHFKRLNDVHGHAAGDTVLREVSKAILSCLRQTDVACRYGGEELAVLLPDCPLGMAEKKAEQIRARIAEVSAGEGLSVTASLGVACHPETSGRLELLAAADAALYEAKQKGRNRCVPAPVRAFAQKLIVIEGGEA